ncbi:uncharacterized protein LOC132797529 [Drosophila nasuta]|uniref:Uncharacterized protein LOC127565009 n=1 Tax=Drosophila albomicans TaxID=7291 RepID=A0A9C6SY42_DROAB|nr:uncharacterized protein LOC127565009 [Drosophila albomicans]XP_060665244.1 uncharacterized protein LOC132797529 [Drosophila nasuta]
MCACFKMTDFSMDNILRSFRKMRMNKSLGQTSQPLVQYNHHQQLPVKQSLRDLKKIIKILKKHVIKQKISRKMKILV